MAERIELEFEGQDRPDFVAHKFDKEFTKRFQTLLPIRAHSETFDEAIDVRLGSVLEESQEQILFRIFIAAIFSLTATWQGCNNRPFVLEAALQTRANMLSRSYSRWSTHRRACWHFICAFFVLGVIVAFLVPLPFLMKRPSPEDMSTSQGMH